MTRLLRSHFGPTCSSALGKRDGPDRRFGARISQVHEANLFQQETTPLYLSIIPLINLGTILYMMPPQFSLTVEVRLK